MTSREFVFAGNADKDVKGFFFKYLPYETVGKLAEEKAQSLVRIFESDAMEFYLQTFTDGNELTAEDQDFDTFKKEMVERYSKRKTEAELNYQICLKTYSSFHTK